VVVGGGFGWVFGCLCVCVVGRCWGRDLGIAVGGKLIRRAINKDYIK
jgi:hypothetical protein